MSQKIIYPLIIASLVTLCGLFVYSYDLNEKASIELNKHSARQYGDLRNEQSEYLNELEEKVSKLQQLQNTPCTITECLSGTANEEIYGTATVQGYYTKSNHTAWGESEMCDEIVVIGGSSKMKDYFKNLVGKGNAINRINEEGFPVININLSNLDSSQQNILTKSTATKPVSIVTFIGKVSGSGAPVCYSFVDLLKVEKIIQPEIGLLQHDNYGGSLTKKTTVYKNRVNGFSLMVPKGWLLPDPNDNDPHLYDERGCGQNSQQPCFGIEIQYGGNDSSVTIEQMFQQILEEKRNPVMLPDLISNALVIKSDAPGPAEGWIYEYDIFFNGQYKVLIFSNKESFESVIRTFTLDK